MLKTIPPVDMAAVGRVARRISLESIRLTNVRATSRVRWTDTPLSAATEQDYSSKLTGDNQLEVMCSFALTAKAGDIEFANIALDYTLHYHLDGDEPPTDGDLLQFARANGAYHAWPFVREFIHQMTYRMGLPPFILPALTFVPPKPLAPKEKVPNTSTSPKVREASR